MKYFIYIILILSFLLVSCEEKKQPIINQNIEEGGMLTIGVNVDAKTLNPLTSTTLASEEIIQHIFMCLIDFDENLEPIPELAEHWEFSNEYLDLTYYLHKGLVWEDGEPLTAYDVKFSYELYTDPLIAFVDIHNFDFVDKVEVIDDYTIKFVFREAYADELYDTNIYVLPKHILEEMSSEQIISHSFNEKPIGCGPFKLESWTKLEEIVLVANENFYKGRPPLDKIIFRYIPEEETRIIAFENGEIDVVPHIDIEYYERIKDNPILNIFLVDDSGFNCISWNLKNPLFQDKRVRQALTYAVNREEIIDAFHYGLAQPAVSPISINSWAYNKKLKPYPYDLSKSESLLSSAGWKKDESGILRNKQGEAFEFTITTDMRDYRQKIAIYLQSQFKKLGIEVDIITLEWSTFTEQVIDAKDFEAMIIAWQEHNLSINPKSLWHSEGGTFNMVSYSNPEVDRLIDKGRSIVNKDEAKKIWYRFQEILYDEQPVTLLVIRKNIHGFNKRIKGIKMDVNGLNWNIDEWWIPKKERIRN